MASKAALTFKMMPTFRDLEGRFARANYAMLEERRDQVRIQAERFVGLAREESPKKTGKFAEKIFWRTFNEGNALGFRAYTPQPLGAYILKGTVAHAIPKVGGKILRFFWQNGPKGAGIYYFRSVWHPGTKPNKFMGRAYRRWLPGARETVRKIATRYKREIMGSK